MSRFIALLAFALVASAAQAQIPPFLGSDGSTYYQGHANSLDDTFVGVIDIMGMAGFQIQSVDVPGFGTGDVIGVDNPLPGTPQKLYKINGALFGTPAPVELATLDGVISDIALTGDSIFGIDSHVAGETIKLIEYDTSFDMIASYDTGVMTDTGGDVGLAYNYFTDRFFFTTPDGELYRYKLGNAPVLAGSFDFLAGASDLGFITQGSTYAAVANLDASEWLYVRLDPSDASYTLKVNAGEYGGGSVGLAVVPAPGSLTLLGAGGLFTRRRRR